MTSNKIKEKLSLVPHTPGCYLMKDSSGKVIYVGKSKNLKNRLTSYFTGIKSGKTGMLVRDIDIFDYILTSSELESLLLEINLIKKYNPKYNILLRDDKSYPYISITNDKIPRLVIVRNPNAHKSKNTKLFGPYPNVTAARKTVDMLNRLYPLRKCNNMPKKVCLYYHIGECLGYCEKNIDKDVINNMKSEIISFLNGNNEYIIKKLKDKMNLYSETLQFEKAMEYKELLDYVTITLEKQKVELDDNVDRDIVNYYTDNNYISIVILFIRGGKLLDKKASIFPLVGEVEEELESFIASFYDKHKLRPKELLIPNIIKDNAISEAFNIKTIVPIKGSKKKILDLAYDNAYNYFNEQLELVKRNEDKTVGAIKELSSILDIPNLSRIELFDNAHLFGSYNVSGMVVFIDGKPYKNEYRKFKITNDKNDDYGTMREVIYRRYFRVIKDNLIKPDLIIVDGGEGQLHVAEEVINELYLDIPVASLKKNDKHNTNELLYKDKIIPIDKSSNLFLLLTRMQDEVHNYTISYHKQIRSKGAISSILDNIDGIGSKRKNILLKKYKTISKMKEASLEELESILPEKVALEFKEFLDNYDVN